MITKKQFIEIMKRLKDTNDTQNKIDEIIRNSNDYAITDFTRAAGIMICHDDIVIDLLEEMFGGTDMISYWVYELNFGTEYKEGCITYENGGNIDIATVDKLYDFLIKEMEEK